MIQFKCIILTLLLEDTHVTSCLTCYIKMTEMNVQDDFVLPPFVSRETSAFLHMLNMADPHQLLQQLFPESIIKVICYDAHKIQED